MDDLTGHRVFVYEVRVKMPDDDDRGSFEVVAALTEALARGLPHGDPILTFPLDVTGHVER
jgi:hypothetical protein